MSMSSILGSQGLVFATAMAVSAGTIILFDLVRDKYFSAASQLLEDPDSHSEKQILRSCLSSGGKKGEKKNNKKKRVKFAADVKDPSGNGEEYRRGHRKSSSSSSRVVSVEWSCCGAEAVDPPAMPANRVALYKGILKDRLQRMTFSY